jgi:hypothetical protein
VASCQRVGVDPFAWFNDVLSRIGTHTITRLTELLRTTGRPPRRSEIPSLTEARGLSSIGDSRTITALLAHFDTSPPARGTFLSKYGGRTRLLTLVIMRGTRAL